MMFDAVIIGAGPAGVSCAIWLKQLGFVPLVIDRNDRCGGLQLSNPYTNTWIASSANAYGKDVAAAMHENMLRHSVQMRLGVSASGTQCAHDSVTVQIEGCESVHARYLVLASGVAPKTGGFSQRIGILVGPGTAVANTEFRGAKVAILGGGDSAFENYGIAKSRGALSTTIFARTIRARSEMLQAVPPEDVVVGPPEVDADSRTVNGEKFDHILVLYGFEASRGSMLGLDIAMKADGFIATDNDCLTSHPLVYAIGEIARRSHPCCVTSMADGIAAAKAIQRRRETSVASRLAGSIGRAAGLGLKAIL